MTNETLRKRLGISPKNYPTASAIIKDTLTKGLIKKSEASTNSYVPFWV